MDDRELLKKRFTELAKRSYDSGIFQFTDFLGLMEQAIFEEIKKEIGGIKYKKFGGADGAERIMIRFGDEEELYYSEDFPIACLKVCPVSPKYAEKLSHRDFLGALMNLGIERQVLGDIVIIDNAGYVFCKSDMVEYISNELKTVRRTDVNVTKADDLPEGELYRTEPRLVVAVGERVDAVIAKVFSISRDDSLTLFKRKLVFIDGRECKSNSYVPKIGEVISVRGYGRMIYRGYETTTKKGKLNIRVDLYV